MTAMVYKYTCLGMVNPKNVGKISWFHDKCAVCFNGSGAGGNAERTDDTPPKNARCVWCGKLLEDEGEEGGRE